ncbi:TPA: hypothetical protein ACVU5P_004256 [Vibrio parahaemolyticus]
MSISVNGTTVDSINFRTEGVVGPMVLPVQYFANYATGDRINVLLKVNTTEAGSSGGDMTNGNTISLTYTRPSDTATRIASGLEKLEQVVLKTSEKKKK